MSILSNTTPLMCDTCPFFNCYEQGTCYECKCFLDKSIEVEYHCDHKTYPLDCPLKNGMIVIIKEIDGKLIIGKDYR